MAQQTSPFIEGKYGWSFGESGWNGGMDENLLKFSYLFDKNVDGVVSSLPLPSNGKAYFLTTDNRLYYVVNGTYSSSPCPMWFVFNDRTTGNTYQFNGTTAVQVQNSNQLEGRITDLETDFDSLGTAAFEDVESFISPAQLSLALEYEREDLVDSANTLSKMLDTTGINIWEYRFVSLVTNRPDANDPKTWDWTPALQAMVDLAGPSFSSGPAPNEPRIKIILPPGLYLIRKVTGFWKIDLFGDGAVIRPFDATESQSTLLQFAGFCNIYNLTIDMNYAMNYGSAIQVRGRHCHFFGVSTWKARTAWIFGDPAWATTPTQGMLGDSENVMTACETVWCITAVKSYGLNTILHFNDCLMYSFKDTLPVGDPRKAAWDALQEITFYNWGSLIYLNGGAAANYSGAYPLLRSELQPVSGDPNYVNSFGRYFLSNTHIETGYMFECGPVGPYTADDISTKLLNVVGCNGYISSTAGNFIAVGADCQQSVVIDHCNFYGQTNNNIIYSLASNTYVDIDSFKNITVDPFQAIHARRLKGYSNFNPLSSSGSAQSLTPALTTVKMPNLAVSDVWASFQTEWYSTSTGIFTAQQAMRNVEVSVGLQLTAGISTDSTDVQLLVNGSQYQLLTFAGPLINYCFKIPRLAIGGTIELRVSQYNSRTLSGNANTFLNVSGNI